MLSYYCWKCRKNTESKNQNVARKKTKESCFYRNVQCDSKKSKFIKEQEASGFLIGLGIKASLSKIVLVGPFLFY